MRASPRAPYAGRSTAPCAVLSVAAGSLRAARRAPNVRTHAVPLRRPSRFCGWRPFRPAGRTTLSACTVADDEVWGNAPGGRDVCRSTLTVGRP
eukprot:365742-Chlamydomonas_euryale.AAC.13